MEHTQSFSSEQQRFFLASVVESSKDSIVTIDFNGIITSWNKSAEQLYGYPANEAIGKNLSMVMLPEDIKQLFVNIDRIKESKSVEIYDTIRLRKGGTSINLEIMLSPVNNDRGEVIGVSTIARDITAWVKADLALRQSEQKFRALVSQSSVGIYQADLSRSVTFINDALCNMLMLSAEELIGQPVWAHTFADDLADEKKLFEHFKLTSAPFETQKRVIRKDGTMRWMKESVSPIYSLEGELESSMGVVIDITGQRELELQKDEFISVASHEMKTPLTSLQAYGQILEDKLSRGEHAESLQLTQKINTQIAHFNRLIMQLLDTGKISASNLTIHKTRFDLVRLVASVIDDLQTVSPNHEIRLVSHAPTVVLAEKERIRQVLTNLISNAVKYSPTGGTVTIECKLEQNIFVSVADEGIGIPDEYKLKVFERFYRVRTAEPAPTSIGLGLYIASEIVKKHGGTIGVKNNEGKGSVFYFTLPGQY